MDMENTVQALDPSHWAIWGPLGLTCLALFGIVILIVRWGLNHFDETSKQWRVTTVTMSTEWREMVDKLDIHHREERAEWRDCHQREWQELKADHAREREEWRSTLAKFFEAIERSSETTNALHLALKEMPEKIKQLSS